MALPSQSCPKRLLSELSGPVAVMDDLPAVQWRKLGTTESGLVVQTQFYRLSHTDAKRCHCSRGEGDDDAVELFCYAVGAMFVSTPVETSDAAAVHVDGGGSS